MFNSNFLCGSHIAIVKVGYFIVYVFEKSLAPPFSVNHRLIQ